MIAGFSKATTLYLAPVLALTATILSLFAFLAPTLLLHDRVALLTVTPSTTLSQPGPSKSIDGPSVFIGILGSCSRSNNNDTVTCTAPALAPEYALGVLPENAPRLLLSAPSAAAPGLIAVALAFSVVFLVTFTLISFRHKMPGKASSVFDAPHLQNASAWIGVFGFMIGFTAFLIIRMWFGKTVKDFNAMILEQGQQGPQLVAEIGNAFVMVYVAYAFFAVPIISSLTKLNVKLSK
ncbi:hypothetical protein CC1G_06733 [Coprinopsis cinerea okayama7|uniref:Uncharacterized protein n=1 Tax=Coprinopsis cinerea (strain Okayama-7 / 130 / ATCC MYA-4618 / FGSC 9003) TaxID=240176 RepID=A8N1Q3_COPC7|nr:hypothetical protein CC1G_06733 [Coprinopsis cinerea okayama7\|eukprot:XP_001828747.1 hypothetical protein CC1G_06733 [Coprinopsis cinerea okayama7\